jgi:hypothetical protein
MRRDQALAQLSPQANAMLYAAADLAENLVKLRAKFGAGTVKAQQETAYGIETDVCDISQLSETGWHAEYSTSFPMSIADERDATISLLKDMPPQVQQALGILDPLNIGHFCQLLGVPGFESALREQQQKTLGDIAKLVQASPIPAPPGPPGTPPGLPMPSVPVDDFDNHGIVAGIMAAWLISERQGGKARATNPNGFANVLAAWQAHTKLASPPPPPPPPPIKGSLSTSLKLEDAPNLIPEILAAAGINTPPGGLGVKPPAPPGQPPLGPLPPGALPPPGPVGAPPPTPEPAPLPIM